MEIRISSGPNLQLLKVNKISDDITQELHLGDAHNNHSHNRILAIATMIDLLALISKALQKHFPNIQLRIYFQTCQALMKRLNTQLDLNTNLKKLKLNHHKKVPHLVDLVLNLKNKNRRGKSLRLWEIQQKQFLLSFSRQLQELYKSKKVVVPSFEISSMYGRTDRQLKKSSTRRYLCLKKRVLHSANLA